MLTVEEMIERKKQLGFSYKQIADMSGVPMGTVQKVLGGITKSPRYDTLEVLDRVLSNKRDSFLMKEAGAVYNTDETLPGKYTRADRDALPESRRTELIDGVIYDMASPLPAHQLIAGKLHFQILSYIESKRGNCVPFMAPSDVVLDNDDYTVVQPDLYVVCDRSQIRDHVYGAPDLVIEITSPSTVRRDKFLKASKYSSAGVKEYWIIDVSNKSVIVYIFGEDEADDKIAIYGTDGKIPVTIYGGDLQIDMAAIMDYVISITGE